jgi:hypothetical protein
VRAWFRTPLGLSATSWLRIPRNRFPRCNSIRSTSHYPDELCFQLLSCFRRSLLSVGKPRRLKFPIPWKATQLQVFVRSSRAPDVYLHMSASSRNVSPQARAIASNLISVPTAVARSPKLPELPFYFEYSQLGMKR